MKPSLCLAAALATQTSVLEVGKKTLFGAAPMPAIDRTNHTNIIPHKNISLHYTSNSTDAPEANVNVTHVMKYPTILLEEIASLINVDCNANSVELTFDSPSIFSSIRGSWSTNETLVLVTNHLGDCDEELERSFFIAKHLAWDVKNLIVTAESRKTDIEHTAASTEISFGGLPAISPLTTRALVLDPSFTLATAFALPDDSLLYSYDPYLHVIANSASFGASATFSGYLKYNWWGFKLEALYFDFDASFDTHLSLTAQIQAAYATTFSYAPAQLQYGFSLPGILEIGPQLTFAVEAYVAASAAVNVSAKAGVKLEGGNVHLDVLNSKNSGTSAWTPGFYAEADIEGVAVAQIDPLARVTVELEAKLFGGLIDLSTGIIASPGFTNHFALSAAEGVATTYLPPAASKITSTKTTTSASKATSITSALSTTSTSAPVNAVSCPNGLSVDSDFIFTLEAFATKWYKKTLLDVNLPILTKCYSWAR